jgi:hypothetical protein
MAWAVELSQYDISYEPRQAIKAQVLAEFLAEMTHPGDQNPCSWTIYVDGSSNTKGSGAGILIENEEGVAVEYSLKFEFLTSNNQAEYEVCFANSRADLLSKFASTKSASAIHSVVEEEIPTPGAVL